MGVAPVSRIFGVVKLGDPIDVLPLGSARLLQLLAPLELGPQENVLNDSRLGHCKKEREEKRWVTKRRRQGM